MLKPHQEPLLRFLAGMLGGIVVNWVLLGLLLSYQRPQHW